MTTQTTLHHIQVGEHRLALLEANAHLNTTPLVLIHGIVSTLYFMPYDLPASVRDHVHWLSLSLPGHHPALAPATWRPADLTPQAMADLINGALQQHLGDQAVMILGHSTGGVCGAEFGGVLSITADTTCLVGTSDPIVPSDQSRVIVGAVNTAHLIEWQGVGHVPMWERYSEYQQTVADWVQQHL